MRKGQAKKKKKNKIDHVASALLVHQPRQRWRETKKRRALSGHQSAVVGVSYTTPNSSSAHEPTDFFHFRYLFFFFLLRFPHAPLLEMDDQQPLLLPGQPFPPLQKGEFVLGDGAYGREGYVVSDRIGHGTETRLGTQTIVKVVGTQPPLALPKAGSTVLGRVTRVNPRQATVSILVVDGLPCGGAQATRVGASNNKAAGEGIDGSDFQGIIRAQDVRSTEKDAVVLAECFRPGDIVRATVISLGDARSYYLSTAQNELGVVHATTRGPSQYGWTAAKHVLQPMSWREMADPVTGHVEPRKCAKPDWLA